MGRSRIGFFFSEAVYEARQSFMTLITPIVFFGLMAYVFTVLLNAESMRSMGAVGIYRNSPHVIFLVVSSQCLWLFFAWAWLFAQILVRDRSAQLHEVVLASPVSLPLLISARFAGALCVAIFMGMSICVGMLISPILVPIGALPESAIGPVPWAATLWSLIVFIIPNAFATGVLFLVATAWTRSNVGAFSVAAFLMLVWMTCLVVMRNGDVSPLLATILDPSGYAEAERQSNLWTPAEKKVAMMDFSTGLIINRVGWILTGIVLGVLLLIRLRREDIALEREHNTKNTKIKKVRVLTKVVTSSDFMDRLSFVSVTKIEWLKSSINECVWHLKTSLRGFGFQLALLLLAIAGTIVSWQHHSRHIDGPLIPTPEAQLLFMVEFYAAVLLFIVVGFVGSIMRRDDHNGFCEWLDSSPIPLGLRILSRFMAALLLTALLCFVPAISSLIVTALFAPQSFSLTYPFVHVLLTLFPALAELCAFTMLVHAVFQRSGTAYVVSIILAFIAVLNHELGLVQYPPAEVMNIIHAHPSELSGWTPWMPMIGTLISLKFAFILFIFAISWIVWRRGTALSLSNRFHIVRARIFAGPGVTVVFACVFILIISNVLNTRFVEEGGYKFTADAIQDRGQWEKDWWPKASPFWLSGGDVSVRLNPSLGTGKVNWRIDDLRAKKLHGTLPNGITIISAQRDGLPSDIQIDANHFVITTNCDKPCTLILELAIEQQGWQSDMMPWFDSSGIWLRAQNVLPTLGHDSNHLVNSIGDRERLNLPSELPPQPEFAALRSLQGVAPFGSWTWSIAIVEKEGKSIETDRGDLKGALDFAFVWLPEKPIEHKYHSTQFLVGDARIPFLDKFAKDLDALRQCVSDEFGGAPSIKSVIQAPRKTGDITLYNDVLWAPEDIAWQNDGTGNGIWRVHHNIAAAIARSAINTRSDLRYEAGANWLVEGASRWLALRCVEKIDGFEAAIAIRKRAAEDLAELFATTDKPITNIVNADKTWLGYYAELSLDNWGAINDRTPSVLLSVLDSNKVSTTLLSRLQTFFGANDLRMLLGEPISSDLSIEHDDSGVNAKLSSFIWKNGGWQPNKADNNFLLRRPKIPAQTFNLTELDKLIVSLEKEVDGAYLFYAGYGYEQSFDDNHL